MLADRVQCATSTTGTGTVSLGSAVPGFRTFAAAFAASTVVEYIIIDGNAFETGRGTFDRAAGTITRGPIASTSNGAAITLSGNATIANAFLSSDKPGDWPVLIVSRLSSDQNGFQSVANNFTTIQLNSVNVDTHGGWSASNYWYTVPQAGVYDCQGKLRFKDNAQPGVSYGIGLDIANQDSASFKWDVTFTAQAAFAARQGGYNSRLVSLTAGQQLRLFAYADNSANSQTPVPVIGAELIMTRVR